MADWQEIVERYGPAAWRTAFRLLGNRADADECLQETFLAALGISRRQSVENWPALLTRLSASRAIDRLRVRDRRRQREQLAVARWERLEGSPDQKLVDQELAEQLRRALVHLPASQAEVFCLHCLDEWSYQQIAEQLSISVDSVGVLLHRARRRLRTLMGPFSPELSGRSCEETDRASVGPVSDKESQ